MLGLEDEKMKDSISIVCYSLMIVAALFAILDLDLKIKISQSEIFKISHKIARKGSLISLVVMVVISVMDKNIIGTMLCILLLITKLIINKNK